MKNYLRIFKIRSGSAGFTLLELLIAMLIMSILMALLGSGLVTILRQNQSAENETLNRTNINRALGFITDEVRMANSASTAAPTWTWTASNGLGSTGTPTPQLYVQIPLTVLSMTASTDLINIPNHGFLTGNVVRFTGTGTIAGGLSINTNYYVVRSDNDNFKIASTLANAVNNTPTTIDLTSNSSGSVTANKLVIYYIIDKTSTWWGNKTVNRSLGPCFNSSTPLPNNCSVLVDAIANNGFTATVQTSRQVTVTLTGQLNDFTNPKTASALSASAFARSQ